MITLHSITLKWNNSFSRWYCYTDTGLLIYIDISICPEAEKLSAGMILDLRGKLIPPPMHKDGGPIASLLVMHYALKNQ